MKARYLNTLLNNPGYIISNHEEYIAVGSPLCHNLISVDKQTLRVKYALDTWGNGRDALLNKDDTPLLFIWDKLHELIASGEIHDIINGRDVIEYPLPVFTVRKGQLVESVTDAYGMPNTDDDGILLDSHFPTREQAIAYGIRDLGAWEKMLVESITDIEEKLAEKKARLAKFREDIAALEALKTA